MSTHAPSPAAVAAIAADRRTRETANTAPAAQRTVNTPADEVRLVLTPRSLADWQAWLDRLVVDPRSVRTVGPDSVARAWHGETPVQLVGVGVPALLATTARNGKRRETTCD